MSDNRKLNSDYSSCDYNSLASVINYNYCLVNKYDFKYFIPHNNGDYSINNCKSPSGKVRHSAWAKLLSTIKCLTEFKEYDYILYIDSDCIFNNPNKKIEYHFSELKSLNNNTVWGSNVIFLNDKPFHPKEPCSGFFILKNNQESYNIFKDWYSTEIPEDERFNTKHCWEQFSLYRIFSKYKEKFVVLDDDTFEDVSPTQFLRHIGSHEKNKRIEFFKKKMLDLNLTVNYPSIINELSKNTIEYDTNKLIEKIYGKS